mgnify:CR=1 FL=1
MDGVFPAPIAETLVFKLPFHLFLVFMGRVIGVLAHGTAEPY